MPRVVSVAGHRLNEPYEISHGKPRASTNETKAYPYPVITQLTPCLFLINPLESQEIVAPSLEE